MTQSQIDVIKGAYRCDYQELTPDLIKRQVEIIIDENTSIIIKKGQRSHITRLQLLVKNKKITIDRNSWEKLCNLKESVLFLHSFINDH